MKNKLKELFSEEKLKNSRSLAIFGRLLHNPYLWRWRRRPVMWGSAVGMFCSFMPVPFQMILATGLSIVLRGNVVVANALVWITNPIPVPPMMVVAYFVGCWVLGIEPLDYNALGGTFQSHLDAIWRPYVVGALLCGIVSAILGYIGAYYYWLLRVRRRLRKRQLRQKN